MIRPPEEIAEYVRFDFLNGYKLDASAPDDVREQFTRWLDAIVNGIAP